MKQTATDYFYDKMLKLFMQYHEEDVPTIDFSKIITEAYEQAKAMEKQQIIKAAIVSHYEGVRQSVKTSKEYLEYGEQYYTSTFNS